MKKRKLDKRHSGYGEYTYYVDFLYKENQEFYDMRNWCWDTWGPSCELDMIKNVSTKGEWAWIYDKWRKRILLKSEKEYNWFCLKWGDKFKR